MTDHNDTGATARPWLETDDGYILLPDERQLVCSVIADPAIREIIVSRVNAYEPLKARLAEVERERDDIRSTLNAWFNTSNKLEPDISKLLLDGLNGYIRRSESGGMPFELADDLRAVIEDFCRLYVGELLTPYIEQAKSSAEARIAVLEKALESIRQYGSDTLSGRADGGSDDRQWQREAVREMTRRARAALAAKQKGTEG